MHYVYIYIYLFSSTLKFTLIFGDVAAHIQPHLQTVHFTQYTATSPNSPLHIIYSHISQQSTSHNIQPHLQTVHITQYTATSPNSPLHTIYSHISQQSTSHNIQPHLPIVHDDVFQPIVLMIMTLAKTNKTLPQDGC
jgi:hypothetical protein